MEGDDAVNQEHAGSQQMLAIAGAAKANTSVNASEGRDGPGSRDDSFYLRYYAGHKGKFGHEFFEFDVRLAASHQSGFLRYANNSNYRNDSIIRKEAPLSMAVIEEMRRIILDSEISQESDKEWPEPNRNGKQELEIRLGKQHLEFETAKLGALSEIQESDDAEGLRVFHFLVQDLKALVLSLIALHFKVSMAMIWDWSMLANCR